eukprot:TRINITY_DN1895_c0_g1_i1.p1 TRINITY_DN1895_c0_g1~~TRINITY_DN1895_c0_g1_i1.p1  ORF type:complete len:107 (+),score=16.71 TRINITY_DN1895_c0_g1_i1:802-1122(+)
MTVGECLGDQAIGVFLIRFSGNNPGHLVISYVDGNRIIKQSLVEVQQRGFVVKVDADDCLKYETLEELILKLHPVQRLFVTPEYSESKMDLLMTMMFHIDLWKWYP